MTQVTGKVKFFNETKGFGFIVRDDKGPDVFVHKTGIRGGAVLTEGARVKFDTKPDQRGVKAVDVELA